VTGDAHESADTTTDGEPFDPLSALTLDELRERRSAKWRTYPPDVLPLWVAEMDVPLPAAVADELHAAIDRGDTGYPHGAHYAEAMRDVAAERWGWDLDIGATALVPDVMRGCVEMIRLVTEPGDAVIVNPPVYPPFYGFVRHAERRIVHAPLGADRRLDLGVLEAAFASATTDGQRAAYLLCSPHNPTGTVHTEAELTDVAALARQHGVRVVVDEIHAPLVLPGRTFVPYLTVPGGEDGFSLLSASKGWNLAGCKAAIAVAGPDAVVDLERLAVEVTHGPSHLGVLAHVAALRAGGAWLDAVRRGIARNQGLLVELLAEHLPEVAYEPGDATYLAWLDCRALGFDDPAATFLDCGRVALSDGVDFGPGGEGHVRLNLATSPRIVTEAVERMAAAAR
jgi:cysteine-S-conjugate beta-lyase